MKNNNYIFYIYYVLVLILTFADLFVLQKTSSSIFYGLASAFIGVILQIFYRDSKKQKLAIDQTLSKIPQIKLFHEEEFYSNFKYIIKNASTNVDITNLSLESPLGSNKPEQDDYYAEFLKVVRGKPRVKFRRVERISKDKIPWIEKLIADFSGVANFSLYVILDSIDERSNELSNLVSIQRIDNEHTFIVALLEHTSTIGYRDIYFRDRSVTEFFREYYQKRLIIKSKSIIINGRFVQSTWESLKREL